MITPAATVTATAQAHMIMAARAISASQDLRTTKTRALMSTITMAVLHMAIPRMAIHVINIHIMM